MVLAVHCGSLRAAANLARLRLRWGTGDGGELVDLGGLFNGTGTVDLVIVLYFIGFFVLGFVQGTIRRLLGIASILFSFLLAANIAGPLGGFLGANWRQFPSEYSFMVGFGTVFIAASIAFALVIQGFYKPQSLFKKARFADEIIGGVLGLIQAALILGALMVILDSFFRIPGIAADPQELPFVREFWGALDGSKFAVAFRDTMIPSFFLLTGLFIPDNLEATYPRI
jgi:uncharacterized membrane protein required for colicin V production